LISDSFAPRWRAEDSFDDNTLLYSLRTVHGNGFVFDVRSGDILEGSRLVAWVRSGSIAAVFCALVVVALAWRWRRRRRGIARPPDQPMQASSRQSVPDTWLS
jgi:hypothetical protein